MTSIETRVFPYTVNELFSENTPHCNPIDYRFHYIGFLFLSVAKCTDISINALQKIEFKWSENTTKA